MAFQQTLSNVHFQPIKISRQPNFKPVAIVITCALFFCSISFISVHTFFELYFLKILQILLFVLLGFFYNAFHIKYSTQKKLNLKQEIVLIMQAALSICTVLIIVYFLFEKSLLIMAFSGSAAFILPFFVSKCWQLFNKIPEKEYKIWIPERRIENTASIFLDSLYLKLKLAKKFYDLEQETYKVYIPYYIKLGEFFSRFIAEKNNSKKVIEDTDNLKKLYAWEFFSSDKYGMQSRRLDPNKNLVDNRIKQSSVILAKRVEPVKLLTYQTSINESIK